MHQLDERERAGEANAEDLAFAAFVLAHTACGEEPVEVRLGERLLLEWCPACAVVGMFPTRGG